MFVKSSAILFFLLSPLFTEGKNAQFLNCDSLHIRFEEKVISILKDMKEKSDTGIIFFGDQPYPCADKQYQDIATIRIHYEDVPRSNFFVDSALLLIQKTFSFEYIFNNFIFNHKNDSFFLRTNRNVLFMVMCSGLAWESFFYQYIADPQTAKLCFSIIAVDYTKSKPVFKERQLTMSLKNNFFVVL